MSKHQWSYISFGILSLVFAYVYIFHDALIWHWIILFLVWLSLVVYGSFSIRFNYHLHAFNKLNTKEKNIVLTFDDGPTIYTSAILDLLKKHHFKATFFCVGKQIEKHPEVFSRIIQEGHCVGNHTYSHDKKMGFKSTYEMIKEIEKTNEIITHHLGKKTLFFRPPFGVTNPQIRKALIATEMTAIGWTIRSLDTVIKTEKKIIKRIEKKIKPGAIILLHDTSEKSVNIVAQLLNILTQKSYQSVHITPELKL